MASTENVGSAASPTAASKPQGLPVTEEMLFMDDPAKWATPKVILPPEYPPGQLAAKSEGHVDVEVKLDKFGMVQSIVSMKSTPPNPEFESAVRDVVQKWWVFHETLSSGCEPLEATGNVRVWFSVREGKGVVSVSGEATEATKEFSRKKKKAKVLKRRNNERVVRYPDEALREGIEGDVYSFADVDAITGIPITAKVTAHFGLKGDARVFEGSVLASMKSTRYEPMAGPNYRVCRAYQFRLTN